jgi:beta-galactosidase
MSWLKNKETAAQVERGIEHAPNRADGFPSRKGCWKSFLLTAFLILLPSVSFAQAAASDDTILLNGTWQFALGHDDAESDQISKFYQAGYDRSKFVATPVPSNWAMQGFEPPHYKPFKDVASQGFYVHRFNVPASWRDRRVLLHFGGVWDSAEVWLNGKLLGRHDSGYTAFGFDVSTDLIAGADNELAVRVRQIDHDYHFDTNDDWAMGGIYRDVWLESMPATRWIDRVDVQTTFDDLFRDADLKVRALIGDSTPRRTPEKSYDLVFTLTGADGQPVQSSKITIAPHPGTDRDIGVTLHLMSPQHWTAETPYLYTLRTELVEDGQVTHARARAVGIRQISTAGGIFRVNGQAIKLRGVDRHDEYPNVGRATTPANWLQDLTLMKAANINFIRTSHYPPADGFLDLCDRMGMYVDDEVPMGFGGSSGNDPAYAGAAMLRAYETLARDVNHPSIILWSIGNENPLTAMHMATIRAVKGMDPTRPVLMPWRADDWLPPEIDILAPHYFTAQQYDELAGRSTRPVISTEYTHAFGTDGFGGLEDHWKALTKHPSGIGGAIWMWADQGLEVTHDLPGGGKRSELELNIDGIDGIVGSYREPQRDYWETKAVYAQVYPAIDKTSFVPGQQSARIPIQNDFDFTDLNAVKIEWQIMEDDRELDHDSVSLSGQPHAAAWLNLRLDKLSVVRPGATYYAWFTFKRADGSEITRRTVELAPQPGNNDAPAEQNSDVTVSTGNQVVVKAGDSTYTFDPRSAQLVSASFKGAPVMSGARPTIWRHMNSTEKIIVDAEGGPKDLPDLNQFHTIVHSWKVSQSSGEVRVDAVADHVADDKDHFEASYTFVVHRNGVLSVHYSIQPQVQARSLPFVGMTLSTAPAFNHVRWLGLGPLDAYPNEKAAANLGAWSEDLPKPDASEVKATRWAELTAPSGAGIRIAGAPYIRLGDASGLEVLSAVAGRPSKRNRAEFPEQRLDTNLSTSFVGEFDLSLVKGAR